MPVHSEIDDPLERIAAIARERTGESAGERRRKDLTQHVYDLLPAVHPSCSPPG